jgi:hypothetical protein
VAHVQAGRGRHHHEAGGSPGRASWESAFIAHGVPKQRLTHGEPACAVIEVADRWRSIVEDRGRELVGGIDGVRNCECC